MSGPFQVADSISTVVVDSETSETDPPITPAIEAIPLTSAITVMSGLSSRSIPSRVVTFSPGRGRP